MFTPLTPILAADLSVDADTQGLLVRIDALAVVMDTVSRLAGNPPRPNYDLMVMRAELPAMVGSLAREDLVAAVRKLDTLGIILQAGLMALDRARNAGRFSKAAAVVLHDEVHTGYHDVLAALGGPSRR